MLEKDTQRFTIDDFTRLELFNYPPQHDTVKLVLTPTIKKDI